MRALVLAVLLAAPASAGPFRMGLSAAPGRRVAAEAERLGVQPGPVAGAAAAMPVKCGVDRMADLSDLRYQTAAAIAGRADALEFELPPAPEGRDLLDLPEEWQAFARAVREVSEMRPVLEDGADAPVPEALGAGALARSWRFGSRRYVLLVNPSGKPLSVREDALAEWRALFSPRSDPRSRLESCGGALCLPPRAVLWLEGRPFWDPR